MGVHVWEGYGYGYVWKKVTLNYRNGTRCISNLSRAADTQQMQTQQQQQKEQDELAHRSGRGSTQTESRIPKKSNRTQRIHDSKLQILKPTKKVNVK